MTRISRDEMLMEWARTAAKRTDCQRAPDGVGAIIASDSRCISTGYAGPPSGSVPCGSACDLSQPCTRTIHAEANAILFAARKGIAVEGCSLYVTVQPCLECAKMIINSGIVKVIYLAPYRLQDGINLLIAHNVEVEQWKTP